MTIRVYTSEDPEAPQIPSAVGNRTLDTLRLILKACLVDGYGDKEPAGWVLGHDVPDGFSLGNGTGFVNWVAGIYDYVVSVYIMEQLTDPSTPLAGGINVRSGYLSDSFTTNAILTHSASMLSGTWTFGSAWSVVADEKTCTFTFRSGNRASQYNIDSSITYGGAYHFGEFHAPAGFLGWVFLGVSRTTSLGGTTSSGLYGNGGTCLRNPFTGAVDQGNQPQYEMAVARTRSALTLTSNYEISSLEHISLVRVGLSATGSVGDGTAPPCGRLRGLVCSPEISSVYPSKLLTPVFGIENPTPEDMHRELPSPFGPHSIVMGYPTTSDTGWMISTDPEDWE